MQMHPVTWLRSRAAAPLLARLDERQSRRSSNRLCCTLSSQRKLRLIGEMLRTLPAVTTKSLCLRTVPFRASRRSVTVMASKKVLVPIGTGSEEMEAIITVDVLRRAGAEVTVASVEDSLEIKCSRSVKVVADKLIGECAGEDFDLIALPGGMPGAERLRDSAVLTQLVAKQASSDKLYAAICATPAVAFEPQGLLKGKKATAHPAFSAKLADQSAVNSRVVVDGKLVTSRGPGTAFEFALALVKILFGEEKMREVAGPMVMYEGWDKAI